MHLECKSRCIHLCYRRKAVLCIFVVDHGSVTCTEMMVFLASFVHIVYAKLGQADAGDNEAKLMTKLAPEWVRNEMK